MKSALFLLTFLLTFCFATLASTQSGVKSAQFGLNQASPNAMATYQLGDLVTIHKKAVLKGTYNFSVQGGAISTIPLRSEEKKSLSLPKGAIVSNCVIDVITPLTSGGSATVAIETGQAGNDLKAALAYGSYTALVACIPVGSAATSIKLTADRVPAITIAGATLTAGKFNVLIEYFISD